MMRRFGLSGLAMLTVLSTPYAAVAQHWSTLDGAGITKALTGKTLVYGNAWQDFRASGKTLYNAGADSWGNWRVQSDQYCSQWPPRDLWDCYDVERSGDQIKFIGQSGDETIGTYQK